MKLITPSELIDAFLAGETNMRTWTKQKPGPLRIMNDKIICFETVICEMYGEFYIVNPKFYSRQTEIAQKNPFGSHTERKANADERCSVHVLGKPYRVYFKIGYLM